MSVQSRQALRLMKFIAELKKNNFPNAASFSSLLRQADVDENIACACSTRTIMRDIETLQKDFHAPIDYDNSRRGYYLKDPEWEFTVPVMHDDILSMTLLGTKLASDILPEPVRGNVNSAVEKVLTGNSSEFFDEAMIASLLCASGIKAPVEPVIFKKIFDGWRRHQAVRLTYRDPAGKVTVHEFEPHIIAFHKGVWYAKGYLFLTRNIRIFAIQRISSVEFGVGVFETDKKLLAATLKDGLFEYPRIKDVQLLCDSSIAFYLREHQKSKKFRLEPQQDGSLIVTLKPAFEHDVIRYVLGEAGKIEVLSPPELRAKVAEAAKKIWERNR